MGDDMAHGLHRTQQLIPALHSPIFAQQEVIETRPKLWGQEEILVNNDLYCGKRLTVLNKGLACSLHWHLKKLETFFIATGVLYLQVLPEGHDAGWPTCLVLHPNTSLTIQRGVRHRFWSGADSDCVFYEFSTHDEADDSIRVIPSGPIPEKLAFIGSGSPTPGGTSHEVHIRPGLHQ